MAGCLNMGGQAQRTRFSLLQYVYVPTVFALERTGRYDIRQSDRVDCEAK
jgi:hypothetical protein